MIWLFAGLVACSEPEVRCFESEVPRVESPWCGNDLDLAFPGGARTLELPAWDVIDARTLTFELTVDGAPRGVISNCFAPALRVPVRWTLASDDGYVNGTHGGDASATLRDGRLWVLGETRARRADWPFEYSSAPPDTLGLVLMELEDGRGILAVDECFRDGVCLRVYSDERWGADERVR